MPRLERLCCIRRRLGRGLIDLGVFDNELEIADAVFRCGQVLSLV